MELSDFCVERNIILYCLYPDSTHIIQPCDVAIFKPLKSKWRTVVQQREQKTQKSITKTTFAPLFKDAFDQLSEDSIKNGFRVCGLYPFDKNAVNYDRCISTRRQEIKRNQMDAGAASQCQVDLTRNDFVATAKFFDHFLAEQKIREFTHLRRIGKPCYDPNYVLWNACMDGLECNSADKGSGPSDEDNEDALEIPRFGIFSSSSQNCLGCSSKVDEINELDEESVRPPSVRSSI